MGYAAVKCFLVEATEMVRRSARCYIGSPEGKCEKSGLGYCNAEVYVDEIASPLTTEGYDRAEADFALPDSAPWPTHCACGREFSPENRSTFTNRIYKRADNGERFGLNEINKAPGAIFRSTWMEPYWVGADGHSYCCVLPNGRLWQIDGVASNCTMKNDTVHKCWIRHGVAPEFTVDKDGPTCAAGGGSILADDYHGFLQNGWLTAGD